MVSVVQHQSTRTSRGPGSVWRGGAEHRGLGLVDRSWQPTSGSGASCGKFACFPDLVDGFQGEADPTAEGLWRARGRRWGMTGRRVGSLGRAAIFIDTVGFALLFPAASIPAPSLWEAVAGDAAEPFASGMGPAEQKVWAWKDQLPRHSQAWYGRFVGNRGSFLSPTMLALLYPGDGDVADHASLPLSQPAHEIASALIGGPLPSDALRAGVGRRHYQRAVIELQKSLLVTTAGVQENRTGWPSAVLDLTCRRFNVGGQRDHRLATERFLQTMVEATPKELCRCFGWTAAQARKQLDALVAAGVAERTADRYRATSPTTC